ncbi:ATP-dependent DNA helicase RecQ [bacterium]|nr:ATP-dependent DNA helicase RecQ [bacterium]
MQFQAGYVLDSVSKALKSDEVKKSKVEGLFRSLSYFDVQTSSPLNRHNVDSIVAVANNIVTRGLPTKPSLFIEESFAKTFEKTEKKVDTLETVSFDFKQVDTNFENLIFRAFHIIDPTVRGKEAYRTFKESWEALGSRYEEDFLFVEVPRHLDEAFVQLLDPQRNLESLLRFAIDPEEGVEKYFKGSVEKFFSQHADFAIELPFKINGKSGIVVEIDGSQHNEESQRNLDNLRDDAVQKAKWAKTVRIKTSEFDNISVPIVPLKDFMSNEYFSVVSENYHSPLIHIPEGREALQFALAPFAIARIQKVIIESILAGVLNLSDSAWCIGVIERDIAGAKLAVKDLEDLFSNLFSLEGLGRKLPAMELSVFSSEESIQINISSDNPLPIDDIASRSEPLDLLLDCSVLQRRNIVSKDFSKYARHYVVMRSSYAPVSKRKFCTHDLIKYAPILKKGIMDIQGLEITEKTENELCLVDKHQALRYFLNNLFRKLEFRPGQRSILDRALQLQNVVGLLPTGGGKSLTYQLSVLLQPGISMVVDPIKSLMKDQHDSLVKAGIDASVFINSSIKTAKERELATTKMTNGEVLFVFVSPERLQIKVFRDALLGMYIDQTFFSYCVIDEAHCVSEWGHDFRTSYLRLGRNARMYCRRKGSEQRNEFEPFEPSVPLVGLTATASFDVLSDVQRELDIGDEGVLRAHGMDRPELSYRVVQVPVNLHGIAGDPNSFLVRQQIGISKQSKLKEVIQSVPSEWSMVAGQVNTGAVTHNFFSGNGYYENSGLVFCPHRDWFFGVKNIADSLRNGNEELKIGTYVGSSNDDETERHDDEISAKSQDDFLTNKLNLMVATKAFGMGIDKPNVRFTVHFNYPSSIEGFYQEAGRAGRDRNKALCYLLFSDQHYDKELLMNFHKNSFKGPIKEKSIIYELLDEITYSAQAMSNEFTQAIEDEFGIDIYFGFSPWENPTSLYINETFHRSYGNIGLTTLSLYPDQRVFDIDLSRRVLSRIKEMIQERHPSMTGLVPWLMKEVEPAPASGIEERLGKVHVGDSIPPVTVGFRNDKIRRIREILCHQVSNQFTERMVLNASKYCFEPDKFIENLKKEHRRTTHLECEFTEESERSVKKLLTKIRDENDTYKAVYRLSTIGVIDDYVVDYNSKAIILYSKKKADQEYISRLNHYLRRYVSEERANRVFEEVHKYKGNSIIQKCLGYLIEFVYSEIEKKRSAAIDAMAEACHIGSNNRHDAFREYLDLYFNSKYYFDLVKDTSEGKEYTIEVVWKYLQITDGNIDNLKHLRGACVRLLIESPDNGALLLLKAYSIFLVSGPSADAIDGAVKECLTAFQLFRTDKNMRFTEFENMVSSFKENILKYNSQLETTISDLVELLFLNHHNQWLKQFNNQFLEQYERRNS